MGNLRANMHPLIAKVAVIGDIHAEDAQLENVLTYLGRHDLDAVLCTGDLVDGFGDADKCLQLIQKAVVISVSGNHERWLINHELRDLPDATSLDTISPGGWAFIKSLPTTLEFQTPTGLLLLCHGLGENDMARLRPYDDGYAIEFNADLQNLLAENRYTYVIGGHTHKKMIRKFDPTFFINPGSLKQSEGPSFLIIDFGIKTTWFYTISDDGSIVMAEKCTLT